MDGEGSQGWIQWRHLLLSVNPSSKNSASIRTTFDNHQLCLIQPYCFMFFLVALHSARIHIYPFDANVYRYLPGTLRRISPNHSGAGCIRLTQLQTYVVVMIGGYTNLPLQSGNYRDRPTDRTHVPLLFRRSKSHRPWNGLSDLTRPCMDSTRTFRSGRIIPG
jgi:hypothetical protein